MRRNSQQFKSARKLIAVFEIIGWLAIVAGAVVAMIAFGERAFWRVFSIGALVVLAGLVQVLAAQIARAVSVIADNSGEIVARLGTLSPDNKSRHSKSEIGTVLKAYKGRLIFRAREGFQVGGSGPFQTEREAEEFIDQKE